MTIATLQPLADRAALYAALRQDALATATDALGPHRWSADMTGRTITFFSESDSTQQIVARTHLIASLAPGPRSLLWGWAHPQGSPDGLAARLRAHGESAGIAELATAEVPFSDAPEGGEDLEDWIAQAAHQVAAAAVEITGHSPYYSAPTGSGSRAVFLLETPLPPLTLADAMIALPRLLSSTPLNDPRTSVWGLARLAGWTLEWTDEAFTGARVKDATSTATFRFDEKARIVGMESTQGAA